MNEHEWNLLGSLLDGLELHCAVEEPRYVVDGMPTTVRMFLLVLNLAQLMEIALPVGLGCDHREEREYMGKTFTVHSILFDGEPTSGRLEVDA